MLEVGQQAPAFELPNQNGTPIALSDFEGQRVVLYFYPKAKTGGCTMEAHEFRDTFTELTEQNATVIGISADPIELIKEFSDEEDLPFHLLSDESGEVASKYESFSKSERDGKVYETADRNTYIIGPDGTIEAVFEGVSPEGHANEVLHTLTA